MFNISLTETVTPRLRTTVIGGMGTRIAVQEWGNPDGQPLVFAHAFGTNHLGWKAQVTSPLLTDYRLVTFDHRGTVNRRNPKTQIGMLVKTCGPTTSKPYSITSANRRSSSPGR